MLGPIEVIADGCRIALPEKHMRLLAALTVVRGATSSVDELVEVVWRDEPPTSARKLVQVYVSQLRKALPEPLRIATARSAYALDVPSASLDSARFEELVADAAGSRPANPALALSLADRALALWRGRPYGELAYDDVARGEAERLEELRLVCLEERLAARLALGGAGQAVGEARSLTTEHPFRERFHELAMLALYHAGRQSEALAHYTEARARFDAELGLEPGHRLRQLQQQILNHDPALAAVAHEPVPAVALPAPSNALVGRDRELARLEQILTQRDERLLVLTGAGGTGKTRLAIEAARRAASSFANGTVLVELAPLRDGSLVAAAVAQALDVAEVAGEPLEATLTRTLASLELLLVVDNAEHLREAAPLLSRLVTRSSRLTVLVTSRAVLHVTGESVFPVEPLAEDDALDLLVQRASRLDPIIEASLEDEAALREICRRLDGLPLAIELAAARLRTLTPRLLLERLGARLSLLTTGPRDLPARQQTLRETIDWSVGLLGPDDRHVLARLSAFPAGASLEAAERVCEATLDSISVLVDHNLVRRSVHRGHTRLMLLETMHEYARELLQRDPDDLRRTRDALAEWCRDFATQAEPHLSASAQREWLDALEAEHENLRAALDHLRDGARADEMLGLAVLLSRFWYVRGYLVEGRRQLDDALAAAIGAGPERRRRAHTAAASLALIQGDHAASVRFAELALDDARAAGEPRFVANALSNLGAIVLAADDRARAAIVLEEAVVRAREVGDERIAALAINNLGDLALTTGDYLRAGPLFEESLALLRKRGDDANVARSLFNNGAVRLMLGDAGAAASHFRESLELCSLTGDREDTAWSLIGLAAVEVESGEPVRASVLLGAGRAVLERMGADYKPFERHLDLRTDERCRARAGGAAHTAGLGRGAEMTLDEALQLALAPG